MTALLLSEQNLSRGAVRIVEAVSDVADELGLDRIELLRGALRGLADMNRLVRPETLREMGAALEARFPGGGPGVRRVLRRDAGPSCFGDVRVHPPLTGRRRRRHEAWVRMAA